MAKRKEKTTAAIGRAYITAGFNNTMVTVTTVDGKVICWGSAGSSGFKGSKKSTPYAATITTDTVGKKAASLGVKEVSVFIKGPGAGRNSAVKSLRNAGLRITSISDITPIPHNGCRPPKRRRV